ncbi:MAG: hypothetical protein KL863_01220 [Rhizobium sp.]|nr:hypothetical protein [Rhizobium sp.]
MNQPSDASRAKRTLACWRRDADCLSPARFLVLVAIFSLGAMLLQFAIGFWTWTDYVGIDPDDTMRLVEVRDMMAGQGWFDLHQYRLGPDGGTLMHWSRLIDWPIAQLIRFYGLFLGPQQAEVAALATWPVLLVVPLLASIGLASYRLGGKAGMVIALILALAFLAAIVRFRPGAIDHHNVQLVLVTFIAAMLLDPLARAASFAAAALAGAMALAIGAETTPLVAVAAMSVALLWAIRGQRYRHAAIGFGLTFALAAAAIFVATTPPRLWGGVACDVLSLGYLALASAGGILLAASAYGLTDRGPMVRFGALAATGLVVLGLALLLAPQCLQSPLSDLDPLLKTYWISNIREAQSIVSELNVSPENIGAYYAVGVISLTVCLMRILRGENVVPHALLLGLIAVSWAVSAVQVRGMLFANFLAFIPLSALVADLRGLYLQRRDDARVATAFALSALLSVPSVWALVGLLAFDPSNALAGVGTMATDDASNGATRPPCVTSGHIADFAAMPAGRVLSSFNEAPALLRFTPHSVLGANYHRNQRGMVAVIKTGMAEPGNALARLEAGNVRYVLLCAGDPMIERIARDYPAGLFASLLKDYVPGYLEQHPTPDAAGLRIYEVIQR